MNVDPTPGTAYVFNVDVNGETDGGGSTEIYTNPTISGSGNGAFGTGTEFADSICDSGVTGQLIVKATRVN